MILVTGGMGYIGSHTCVELAAAGHRILILDNLSNSSPKALARLEALIGCTIPFVNGDIRDRTLLDRVLREHQVTAVIHFAGLKAVGDSVARPLQYYDNNVTGTLTLLDALQAAGVKSMVFSSSATVYGDPASVPIREDFPLGPTNPYGRTKLMVEEILRDVAKADSAWRVALLRYFNPVGAHVSGTIGEDPRDTPNNLMPYVSQVAVGKLQRLRVFGNDYPTVDGTGVRDYLHVVDLAQAHVRAVETLATRAAGVLTVNLGTGRGYSVLEVVKAFEQATGRTVPYEIVARRPGDIAACYADPSYAAQVLGWRAQRDLKDMCVDAWRWQSNNPHGYGS